MQNAPTEFSWKNPNGNKIYAVEWPVVKARAVVGLIHGVGEHCRRYDHLAAAMQAQDIAMIGYDRQGFGRSQGPKGHADNFSEYIDEIARLVLACERRYPDTPLFLYGHSMGGHLLLRYLIKRHPNISGAIVSAPHIKLAFTPSPFLVGLGKIMRAIYPTFTQESELDTSLLSRSPDVAPAYEADPYVHGKLSSKMGIDMLESARDIEDWRGELSVPTLLMHGTADGITSPTATAAFVARNPSNLTHKIWEGWYHELHNEPEQEELFAFVVSWITEHLAPVHRPPESV
ncbi:MAG: lysophospholipase [Bacteroidota bacterium]